MTDPNRIATASKRPKALIRLLDSQQIEVVLHSRLSVEDVVRLVAEKLEISFSDSQYFCLGFSDNLNNFHWLDGSVILYDLVASTSNPKGTLTLSHHVRFFVETIYEVQCASTAKLFFFDIHNQLARHELLVASEDYFELVAILVSVFVPDCQEQTTAEAISRIMPMSHPPYILLKTDQSEVERRVFEKFRYYRRLPVGTGMISFIKLAEKSESYGYRMYEALNENNDKCILSIGYKGIYIYRRSRHQNLITPYLAYPWRVIDNLYYRDKKFSIEIREPKNSLHSSSSIGTMPSAKIGDGSTSSLPPVISLNKPISTQTSESLPPDVPDMSETLHNKSTEEFQRDLERCGMLKTKKADLEARLRQKMQELKEVCVQEGDITGEMPIEINEVVLPGDDFPRLKRRVGTAYSIPDELIKIDKDDKVSQMETDVELHRRIVAAASRLATDKTMNKSVRKKRQKDLLAAKQKLSRLEQGLQSIRQSASKPDISSLTSDSSNSWSASNSCGPMLTMAMTKSCPTTPRGSVPDLRNELDDEKDEFDENVDERVSRRAPSAISRHSLSQRYSGVSSSSTSSGSDSMGLGLPPRPVSCKSQQQQTTPFDDQLDNPMLCDAIPSTNPLLVPTVPRGKASSNGSRVLTDYYPVLKKIRTNY
ncbi:Protein CBG22314 [Caenorhabditis briggsae]|uniref:Protein CBG22314 n=1 Tax=Caenorhabditis briggsae TaxID=6238 RepID=A8Y219_CAEBR|nr:Protein CBG22314 [Caenorhabditis briggsae]CAP38939.1 Protein CBG22314 [Caenorhabditis briggsae]